MARHSPAVVNPRIFDGSDHGPPTSLGRRSIVPGPAYQYRETVACRGLIERSRHALPLPAPCMKTRCCGTHRQKLPTNPRHRSPCSGSFCAWFGRNCLCTPLSVNRPPAGPPFTSKRLKSPFTAESGRGYASEGVRRVAAPESSSPSTRSVVRRTRNPSERKFSGREQTPGTAQGEIPLV